MKVLALATGMAIFSLQGAMAATPQERAQTRALNLQQSQLARAPSVQEAAPAAALNAMVPLSQVENVPERVATARVADADGRVIGAVQKVVIQDGRPIRIDIALIGSANTVALEAGDVRYDAANNVVATSESATKLLAHHPRS